MMTEEEFKNIIRKRATQYNIKVIRHFSYGVEVREGKYQLPSYVNSCCAVGAFLLGSVTGDSDDFSCIDDAVQRTGWSTAKILGIQDGFDTEKPYSQYDYAHWDTSFRDGFRLGKEIQKEFHSSYEYEKRT